jgi:hypothetical protein
MKFNVEAPRSYVVAFEGQDRFAHVIRARRRTSNRVRVWCAEQRRWTKELPIGAVVFARPASAEDEAAFAPDFGIAWENAP